MLEAIAGRLLLDDLAGLGIGGAILDRDRARRIDLVIERPRNSKDPSELADADINSSSRPLRFGIDRPHVAIHNVAEVLTIRIDGDRLLE